MIIIGIDPGATIGIAVYDTTAGRVLYSGQYCDSVEASDHAMHLTAVHKAHAIGIERARIYGAGGAHVANTIEQVGWLLGRFQASLPAGSEAIQQCDWLRWTVERRAVIKALSAEMGESVKGDAGVWQALCRVHPDAVRRPVVGKPATRTKPAVEAVEAGPLYGVSSHARAALAVAWALGRHLEGR